MILCIFKVMSAVVTVKHGYVLLHLSGTRDLVNLDCLEFIKASSRLNITEARGENPRRLELFQSVFQAC